jgi:hypothetical protein
MQSIDGYGAEVNVLNKNMSEKKEKTLLITKLEMIDKSKTVCYKLKTKPLITVGDIVLSDKF